MAGFLERVPVPICGLALGFSGVAGIAGVWSHGLALCAAAVSAVLLAIYASRCIAVRGSLRRDLSEPVTACILGTATMAVMVLSQHIAGFQALGRIALLGGLALHALLAAFVLVRRVPSMGRRRLHACIFIPFVGFAAAGISAPSVGLEAVGEAATIFAVIMAVVLTPIVLARYLAIPVEADAERPMFCITAAPLAICTVAVSASADWMPIWFRTVLYAGALVLYAAVLCRIPAYLRLGFFPGFAAMTFPLTISASATFVAQGMFSGSVADVLHWVFVVQAAVAVAMVLYVAVRFAMHLRGRRDASPGQE